MSSELELIDRARRGDDSAFSELVRAHQTRIYRVCLAALGDPQEADEAAQDVFVRMHHKLSGFRGESRLATWLYRVALNICADRRRVRIWKRWIRLDWTEVRSESNDRPDHQAERREAREILWKALDRLSRPFREVLILRELEERDYADIAGILGISIGTVESRLFRAREKLRRIMREDEKT